MFVSGTILRYPRSWYVIDLGVVSGESTWKLREPACTHKIILSAELEWKSLFELDLHDSLSLAALLNTSGQFTKKYFCSEINIQRVRHNLIKFSFGRY